MDVKAECVEGRKKIARAKEIVEVMKINERDNEITSERDEKFKKPRRQRKGRRHRN